MTLRRAVVLGLGIAAVLACALVAAGYVFSQELLNTEPYPVVFDGDVQDVAPTSTAAPKTVTLERTVGSLRDGTFGLNTDTGFAELGPIVGESASGVDRRVRRVQGELDRGTRASVLTSPFNGNPSQAVAMPFRAFDYESDIGPMAAWFTPGETDTWAVMVHGYKSNRRGLLRDYGVVGDLDLPMLNVTYRNDPGNPPAADRLIQLGNEEWSDAQAAMRWAMDHGAERFIVFGDSMGGAIVTNLYHRSDLADRIDALVLDAPVLDWQAVLRLQAQERGLPDVVAQSAAWWVERRIGIDLAAFDQIARAGEFQVPILLFHGTQDDVVPFATSQAFARALPDLVTFYPAPGAGHVQAWNVDPEVYERRLRAFLEQVLES